MNVIVYNLILFFLEWYYVANKKTSQDAREIIEESTFNNFSCFLNKWSYSFILQIM